MRHVLFAVILVGIFALSVGKTFALEVKQRGTELNVEVDDEKTDLATNILAIYNNASSICRFSVSSDQKNWVRAALRPRNWLTISGGSGKVILRFRNHAETHQLSYSRKYEFRFSDGAFDVVRMQPRE